MTNSFVRSAGKVAALGCALVLGTFGLVNTAAYGAAPDTIDKDKTGSITIHKHAYQNGTSITGNVSGGTSTSSSSDDIPNPLEKVVYKLFPVKDLPLVPTESEDVNANWTTLTEKSADIANACDGVTEDGAELPTVDGLSFNAGLKSMPTDSTGTTTFSSLSLGAYLLCEVVTPEGVSQKSAPFIVTVPSPDESAKEQGSAWVYDVHVYPKNAVNKLNKTVNQQDSDETLLGEGSRVTFTVTSEIPAVEEDEEFTAYIFEDTLDSRLTSVGAGNVKVGNDPLINNTDYRITLADQKISVSLTASGLTKVNTAGAGATISVEFYGTLTSVGDGTINNVANVWNRHEPPTEPTTPVTPPPTIPEDENPPTTPKVTITWGGARLNKVDSGTKGALEGAVFQVFMADDAYPDNGECSNTISTTHTSPIAVNGETNFTTNSAGVVDIAGLYVADSTNHDGKQARCYVLKEIQAPNGYVLPADGIALKITPGEITDVTASEHSLTIENTKTSVPNLPLTGGAGTLAMTVVGFGLVGTAGVLFVSRRRRAEQNA